MSKETHPKSADLAEVAALWAAALEADALADASDADAVADTLPEAALDDAALPEAEPEAEPEPPEHAVNAITMIAMNNAAASFFISFPFLGFHLE